MKSRGMLRKQKTGFMSKWIKGWKEMISEQCRLFLLSILYGFGSAVRLRSSASMAQNGASLALFHSYGRSTVLGGDGPALSTMGSLYQAAGVLRAYYCLGGSLGVIVCEGTRESDFAEICGAGSEKSGGTMGKSVEKM